MESEEYLRRPAGVQSKLSGPVPDPDGSGNVAGVTCRGRCQLVWKKVSGMSLAQIGFTNLHQAPGTALVQRVVSVTEVATEACLRGCLKRLLQDQWGRLHVSEIKKMIRALKSKVVMLWVPVYGLPIIIRYIPWNFPQRNG